MAIQLCVEVLVGPIALVVQEGLGVKPPGVLRNLQFCLVYSVIVRLHLQVRATDRSHLQGPQHSCGVVEQQCAQRWALQNRLKCTAHHTAFQLCTAEACI